MEATIQLQSNQSLSSSRSVSNQSSLSAYGKLIQKLEFSYFGLISMTILVGSIFGGFAASCVLANDAPIWELILVAAVSMANNTAAIGQAPTKWVMNLFIVSMLTNLALILINIL